MGKVCSECGETFDASAKVCPYDGTQLEEQDGGSDQLVGEVVDDRFRLDAVLGEGGMGKVYEATQLSVDRQVAVKMIRTSGLQSEEITQRFMREARVISGFSHPNIVRLIDFGEDDALGIPYLAMEYLDGLELTELVDDSRLHPNFALDVASQVGAALVEAHDAGIVHRDLKTDNILLMPVSSGACQVKVIDFGIAFPEENNENLTQTGMICGTPHYLSPEQARGDEVEPQSDLYSLGVILFEMATGELPFQADSPFNIMVKHVQDDPPSLTKYLGPNEVPPSFVELVDDMLRKDPTERPDSGREIRRRITEIRDQTNWDPIRLEGTKPLRDAVAPWLLSKNVSNTSEIAFEETVGTDQGANNTSNPGTVDKPLGGSGGTNQGVAAGGSRPGTGQQQPANTPTPGTGQQPQANTPNPGTGQQPQANTPNPGTGQQPQANTPNPGTGQQPQANTPHPNTGQQPSADGSNWGTGQMASNEEAMPLGGDSGGSNTANVPQTNGGGSPSNTQQPGTAQSYETGNPSTVDVAQPDGTDNDRLRTLAIVATALLLLVGGLGIAALTLTGGSDETSSADPPGARSDSNPTPTAGETPPAAESGGESAGDDSEKQPSAEQETADDSKTGATNDEDDTATEGSREGEATAESSDETTPSDNSPPSDDSRPSGGTDEESTAGGSTASAQQESGANPADEPADRTGSGSEPTGGSPSAQTDDDPDRRDQPPSDPDPSPASGSDDPSGSSGSGSGDEDVDKEYKESVDWLTNE